MSLFDLGICSGKMCREPSPAENPTEQISTRSLKKSAPSRRQAYLYLDRREGHGLLPGLLWEKDSLSLGEYWTLNFGVSPKEEIASSLSQILEDTVPEKYYLSPTACGGIIRRSEKRGKGIACYLKAGSADAGRPKHTEPQKDYVICLLDQGGERMDVCENISGTLLAHGRSNPPIIMATSQGNAEIGVGYCPTITAAAGMAGNNQPILFDNHGPDTRYTGPVEVAQTITSALGTGGNNTPLAVNKEPFCIAGNIVNRKEKNGGNGCGYQQGISYTLTTEDRHCIYIPHEKEEPYQKVIGSLCAGDEKMIGNQYVEQGKCIVDATRLVRRLIPLECERLMGFPDYWTDIPKASDSARYRALGNSVAVPCVDFILCGIAYYLREQ